MFERSKQSMSAKSLALPRWETSVKPAVAVVAALVLCRERVERAVLNLRSRA
jgi:hypothetical protein